MSPHEAFERAVKAAGSERQLALATGYSQHAVWHARARAKRVSAEMAIRIEQATGIPARHFRPDLFKQRS